MTLMPEWVQRVASYLPFQWTFFFPIQSLVGDLTPQQLLMGLATQAFWILVGALILKVSWRYAIRHYSAVGN
jgi:ABC-2 type transport system permease protein